MLHVILFSCYSGKNPSLREVFKELLPLAPEWKGIGTLLDVNEDTIHRIQSEKESVRSSLREMLSERMKQAKPLTWDDIVDAVKCYDEEKSKDIRKRISKQR